MAADPGTYDPSLEVLEHFLITIGRQIPFATSQALNDVALEFQNYQRIHQELTFTIREKQFFRFAVKIRQQDRARAENLDATVWIDDSVRRVKGVGASRRPDIWDRLQFQRTRKPKSGNKRLAVPRDEVKRTGRGLIKASEFPNKLKRSFTAPLPSGDIGLFTRIGRRQKAFVQPAKGARPTLRDDPNVRFLYALKKKTPLKPEFNYYSNAHFVFRRQWQGAWERRLIAAFRTIRFRRKGFR